MGWVNEFERWRAGDVRHVFLHLGVFDGELGYVGQGEEAWALMHIRDGAVTPLVVGATETIWAKRPRTWQGRAHVPVPAVVLGGVRRTFTPIWGRVLLGVARCPRGRVILLGIVGEEVGMVVLAPEPVLAFVGRPQEIGTVNLDLLDWLTRPAKVRGRSAATSTRTRSVADERAPAASGRGASPLQVAPYFDRVRAAVARASHSRRWTAAEVAEIPQVIDALERWAREGRGPLAGRRQRLHATLAAAVPDFHVSLDGFTAALDALAQVCGDLVTAASPKARYWTINMDPALFAAVPRCPVPAPARPEKEGDVEEKNQVADDRDGKGRRVCQEERDVEAGKGRRVFEEKRDAEDGKGRRVFEEERDVEDGAEDEDAVTQDHSLLFRPARPTKSGF